MNLKNLILTSTANMSREQWLEFRKPINHVKDFLYTDFLIRMAVNPSAISKEDFFRKNGETYKIIKKAFESKEWEQFIFPCLGGSEIASVLGLSPYKSVIELYYEKVGLKPVYDQDNAAMFWGRTLEATIADHWQYWQGSVESMLENCRAENIVRKCRRMNAYVQNRNFPWLYVSLDRVINKHDGKEEGALECKTISGYSANMWENGIPPMYVAQLQAQLMACDFDYGEMAILKDGREYDVFPFDRHEGLIERLKEQTQSFFHMVKKGIEQFILASYCPDQNLMADHLAKVDYYSPEPDGSLAYEMFLKEQYKDYGHELEGNDDLLIHAKNYIFYKREIDKMETLQRECSNILKAFMKDSSKLSFGEIGIVTWKANAKGSRVFNCKIKCEQEYFPEVKTNTQKALEEI